MRPASGWEWALLAWVPVLVVLAGWLFVRWDRRGPPGESPASFAEPEPGPEVGEGETPGPPPPEGGPSGGGDPA